MNFLYPHTIISIVRQSVYSKVKLSPAQPCIFTSVISWNFDQHSCLSCLPFSADVRFIFCFIFLLPCFLYSNTALRPKLLYGQTLLFKRKLEVTHKRRSISEFGTGAGWFNLIYPSVDYVSQASCAFLHHNRLGGFLICATHLFRCDLRFFCGATYYCSSCPPHPLTPHKKRYHTRITCHMDVGRGTNLRQEKLRHEPMLTIFTKWRFRDENRNCTN